jgi:site-specific recombinase XerD
MQFLIKIPFINFLYEAEATYKSQTIKSRQGNINEIPISKLAMDKEKVIKKYQQEINHCYSKHVKLMDANILKVFNKNVTKDYSDITKDDIVEFFDKLINGEILTSHNKPYSPYTIEFFKSQLKKFFVWYTKVANPEQTAWLKTNKKAYKQKTASDILSLEEIKLLIKSCTNVRDKAIIAVLYDSAMRISEFTGLKLRNILRDRKGVVLEIEDGENKKTGARNVPLTTFSIKYLDEWLSVHPYIDDRDASLWLGRNGNSFTHNGVKHLLFRARHKAGLNKKISPHIFRHSRLTELGKTVTEQYLRIFAGWSKDSNTPNKYIHPDEEAVRNKILSIEPKKKLYTEEEVEAQFEDRLKVLEQKMEEKMVILDSSMAQASRRNKPEINSEQILQDYHKLRNGLLKIYGQMIAEGKFAEAEKFRKLAEQGLV